MLENFPVGKPSSFCSGTIQMSAKTVVAAADTGNARKLSTHSSQAPNFRLCGRCVAEPRPLAMMCQQTARVCKMMTARSVRSAARSTRPGEDIGAKICNFLARTNKACGAPALAPATAKNCSAKPAAEAAGTAATSRFGSPMTAAPTTVSASSASETIVTCAKPLPVLSSSCCSTSAMCSVSCTLSPLTKNTSTTCTMESERRRPAISVESANADSDGWTVNNQRRHIPAVGTSADQPANACAFNVFSTMRLLLSVRSG
mmetsp:Transcript_66974/g.116573  ORF Transcript_66974/g.116573 Transcript_66974/m.116573 type:complete len:259 (+) Transcript_66974:1083-1859(+)